MYVIDFHSLFTSTLDKYFILNKAVSLTKYINYSTAKTQCLKGSGICKSVYAFITQYLIQQLCKINTKIFIEAGTKSEVAPLIFVLSN